MLRRLSRLLLVLTFGALPARAATPVDFNRDIRPILSNACYKCHGPDAKERKGGTKENRLRLDTQPGATAKYGDITPIVPGHPEQSEVVARITTSNEDDLMPPAGSGKKLTPHEVDLLKEWIAQGARYAVHWSYAPVVRSPLPVVKDARWSHNPIDAFVLQHLNQEGLSPQPQADKQTLIRRVSLDLTGLPPTPEELDQFLADQAADAYERLVDRLLAKPAYGEHWARMWLDLARYADSGGYASDSPRTIWLFRDYVIKSFNANKPFDQFTIEQLAGDLLPNPTEDQLIATAFHRNTMTNTEGGTTREEFRNAAVVDRVNTTMGVWMGTSITCCQCHDHKYDPLTQKEYFRLFAILNNTEDADRPNEEPTLKFETPEQKKEQQELAGKIKDLEKQLKGKPAAESKAERAQLAALKKQKPGTKGLSVPIMKELAGDQRRKTFVQLRGNYLSLGDEVTPGVPAAFHPLPADVQQNGQVDRLALARWLVDANNPLTPRVIVNRYWEQIFGIGIVRTSEEFGSQGEPPSHPELLDWLASELIRDKWDTKQLLRLMVTSEAYKQSSRVTPELAERDPENRLIARGPRFRMSAEMIRDQALAAAGLLSPKMLGPSVRPARPSAGLSAAFGGGLDWQTSAGEDRYRRAVYTEVRRTAPYPSSATFDAPSREVCTLRRNRTNTPLQALVTLNDPVYVEAAQGLARRMVAAGSTPADRLSFGFRAALVRPPTVAEIDRLSHLAAETKELFSKDPTKVADLATNPIGPVPAGVDVADLAAWTTVANVILNLDETMMKR